MDAPLGFTQVKIKVPKRCFEDFETYFKNNVHMSRIERYEPTEDMFGNHVNVLVWSNDIQALNVLRAVGGSACSVPDLRKELQKKKYLAAAKPVNAPKAKPTKAPRVVKLRKPKPAPKKPIVGYMLIDPVSGEMVASKKTLEELRKVFNSLEENEIGKGLSVYVYSIVLIDGKNRKGERINVNWKKPMAKRQKPTPKKATPKPKQMAAKKKKTASPLQRMKRAARLLVKPTGLKADGTLKKGYTRLKNGDVVKRTLVKKCSTSAKKKTTRKTSKSK